MPPIFHAAIALIQRGVVNTAYDDFPTISTRATVTRKKSRVKGTQLASWQLAVVVVGSVIAFVILTLLAVGIIRWHRAKQPGPETDKETVQVDENKPEGHAKDPGESKAAESKAAESKAAEGEVAEGEKVAENWNRQGQHAGWKPKDGDGEGHDQSDRPER
ncbi:Nn.00g028650.m01.CDS01 [Neocucurbitaria sp. VM-36]